jgi:hypothetical protein
MRHALLVLLTSFAGLACSASSASSNGSSGDQAQTARDPNHPGDVSWIYNGGRDVGMLTTSNLTKPSEWSPVPANNGLCRMSFDWLWQPAATHVCGLDLCVGDDPDINKDYVAKFQLPSSIIRGYKIVVSANFAPFVCANGGSGDYGYQQCGPSRTINGAEHPYYAEIEDNLGTDQRRPWYLAVTAQDTYVQGFVVQQRDPWFNLHVDYYVDCP